ncbi:uncharacterized protein KGF55_004606 [Candida pseudojiufengensis]|uniref:uncharacterized protein n=1 Tax=Candida pseudojiufengensis TaxID=497109 RepID=UPI00222432B9|nr:uncharacterized protein KGF55_004606 [Candida pseudojiufengensis]KAI5960314.1 hypothetical protein KGF55_004606 [Candida pseudojiufengensis]
MTTKILVLNPNPNELDKVLEKANVQNSKNGPFEATILVGDVIPKDKDLPTTQLKQSTYFGQGYNGISDKIVESEFGLVDIQNELIYVKPPFSVIKLISGTTMLILSGPLTRESINEISKIKVNIDLLFTYKWPKAIAELETISQVSDELVDLVVQQIKPKYHFAVGTENGVFLELEPFKWSNNEFTRFISLGQEGSGGKWFYAFNLIKDEDIEELKFIENPFTMKKRKLTDDSKQAITKKPKVVSPSECFFCVGNPKTETHLIVSVGKHSYLTVAKGPLTRSNQDLSFSGHGIIIPIQHISNITEEHEDIRQEINKFQSTIYQSFVKQKPFLSLIFFEINRFNNIHHNIQFLPIHESQLKKFQNSLNLKAKINNEKFKRNQSLEFKEFDNEDDPELLKFKNLDYIKFTIYSKNGVKIYITKLFKDKSFDLQFPRRVLCHLLNLPDRLKWENCQQPKYKEMSDCEEFKKFYKDYEFT